MSNKELLHWYGVQRMVGLGDVVLSCLPGLFVAIVLVIFYLGSRSLLAHRLPAIPHLPVGRATEVERVRCKDPPTFSGNTAEFKEWLFPWTRA